MWDFIKDNWIALVALIISIISFFKDNIKDIIKACQNKKINNSAVISVSYINEKLIISNKGKSNAMNIHIYIDNEDITESGLFAPFARDMNFSLLTPGNSFGIKHIKYMGMKRNFNIKVTWEDNNSKNNFAEDVINV